MKYLIKSCSYIFHPLWMPLTGVLLYFYTTPRFINGSFLYSKIFATAIMTVVIPILSYFMLKNLRVVSEIHLKNVKERRYPLLMQILFTLLLLNIVFKGYELPELHFFFIGILISAILALLLVYFSFKASLHMIGVAGVFMFLIGLSIHFRENLLGWISIFAIALGATATSRLEAKAHTYTELLAGFFVGALPQLLVYKYWI